MIVPFQVGLSIARSISGSALKADLLQVRRILLCGVMTVLMLFHFLALLYSDGLRSPGKNPSTVRQ